MSMEEEEAARELKEKIKRQKKTIERMTYGAKLWREHCEELEIKIEQLRKASANLLVACSKALLRLESSTSGKESVAAKECRSAIANAKEATNDQE